MGDSTATDILSISTTAQLVHVDLDVRYSRFVKVGDTVRIRLADGTKVTGTVATVATSATVTPGGAGQPPTTTVGVDIAPNEPISALDESPVTVTITSTTIAGALAVPVEAIVATADGRSAVETVADSEEAGTLVEVTLGPFADGWVQITGDVTEGQKVVTA